MSGVLDTGVCWVSLRFFFVPGNPIRQNDPNTSNTVGWCIVMNCMADFIHSHTHTHTDDILKEAAS